MKVAHIKTVDGTTTMINLDPQDEQRFNAFINQGIQMFTWMEHNEVCRLFRQHIISIRIREVEDK